jgi:hypothetical protein
VLYPSNNVRYKTAAVCLSVTDRIIATVITLVTRNPGAGIFYAKNFNALWRVILRENAVML